MNPLIEFFYLSKRERNGMFLLAIILILLIVIPLIIRALDKPENVDFSAFEKEISEFEKNFKKETISHKKDFSEMMKLRYDTLKLFSFNPNIASESELKKLGFTERQIKNLRKYLEKGGKIRDKEDFSKIYTLLPYQIEKLLPFVQLPEKIAKKTSTDFPSLANVEENTETYVVEEIPEKKTEVVDFQVDINISDTTELIKINGIGAILANRIVKYREMLGGFHSKNQLLEVYGLKSETFEKILKNISLDSTKIKKIRLNFCTLDELKKHPYLKYKLAKKIIDFRNKNGSFSHLNDLKIKELLTEEEFEKVKFYLTVE